MQVHYPCYTLTDKAGNEYLFGTEGKLKEITEPGGKSVSLSRTENTLTVKENVSGEKLKLTYNKEGLIDHVTDDHGREASFAYDENDNLISFTDALGQTTTYQYDGKHCCLAH